MRYFLKLSYNGASFHGWQSQPNAISVQETIEQAISLIFRENIRITGAGRTDTGVHAKVMYAHFDVSVPIENKDKLINSANNLIGKEIIIHDIIQVDQNAHARFDATSRTYKYFITYKRDPFFNSFSYRLHSELDIDKMNEAASLLLPNDDFTSFAKLHSDAKTNICKVSEAFWERIIPSDNMPFTRDGIVFTISADRFLRNMVRAIVGSLIDVGRGKRDIQDFKEIIEKKDRCFAGESVPAQGLFLWDITYPYINSSSPKLD